MNASQTTQRIVIVGGGIAGLATSVRLAQAGLPVTLLEGSQLGSAASTRNQGWLHSGGLFALDAPAYARTCAGALAQTLKFCPDCLEPQVESMAYLFSRPDTLVEPWKQAWAAAGLNAVELPLDSVFSKLPGLQRDRIQHAFQLPDRAIRLEILLTQLAATAQNAGVEIRTGTLVRSLARQGDRIEKVLTSSGEEIRAKLVILAGGATGFSMCNEFLETGAGQQPDVELIVLKTHLIAAQPEVGLLPFCIPDREGFNQIPHRSASVFGSGRWERVSQPDDQCDPHQADLLRQRIREFFPGLGSEADHAWAGTMIQPLRVDQIEPGGAIWPAVIDHARMAPHVTNLLSIFSGRATLWTVLAEETRRMVLAKLDHPVAATAHPPWVG